MRRNLLSLLAVAAVTLCSFSATSASTMQTNGNPMLTLTVSNRTQNRWAFVSIEGGFGRGSDYIAGPSFCLKNGESKTIEHRFSYLRIHAALRKLGDCRTPNVIETLDTGKIGATVSRSLAGPPIFHRDVVIEGRYTFTIRALHFGQK